MIALIGATAITLTALQASINAPTDAFRGCLRQASEKAKSEKVDPTTIETYLRDACSVQMSSLKGAVVAFRVKNGMARKSALSDADMTVDDYIASPVDKYQFMATLNTPKTPVAASVAAPAAASAAPPAAAATQPPPKP